MAAGNLNGAKGNHREDKSEPKRGGGNGSNVKAAKAYPTIESAIEVARWGVGKKAEIPLDQVAYAAHWIYHNADGAEVGVVVRFDLPTPADEKQKKTFRPLHRIGTGWGLGDPMELWPLYRLAALNGCTRVYLTEGEKACEAGVSCGLPAFTSAHGALSPEKTDWAPLAAVKEIIILPDHDKAGEEYAQRVAACIRAVNAGAVVRVLRLAELAGPGFPVGGDFADFSADFRDGQDVVAVRAEVEAAADRAEPVKAEPAAIAPTQGDSGRRAIIVRAADIKPQQIRYLWPTRIPEKKITLLAGVPGAGKSFLAAYVAAIVSQGFAWPDFPKVTREGADVLMIMAEDDPADMTVPRLIANHADLARIHFLTGVRRINEATGAAVDGLFNLSLDLGKRGGF